MANQPNEKASFKWEKFYTVILIANAIYILLFYLIMKAF
jgi:hypothetical protein